MDRPFNTVKLVIEKINYSQVFTNRLMVFVKLNHWVVIKGQEELANETTLSKVMPCKNIIFTVLCLSLQLSLRELK